VAATLFAWLLLNETLSTSQVIGGAIVLLGAFVAQSSVGKVAPPELPITEDVPESVRG
jgi:drug/metabolite transporter (DMT)-like permease